MARPFAKLAVFLILFHTTFAHRRTIDAPLRAPQHTSDVVSHNFQSWACAVHSWPDYAGNHTHPNLFSKALVGIIANKTGSQPHFRVGGTSGDRTTFIKKQTVAIKYDSLPGTQIPTNVTIGPAFFEAFDTFQDLGVQYTWMVNLAYGDLDNAVTEARLGLDAIGSQLEALEIGNEVDLYVPQRVRHPGWAVNDYVREWLAFVDAITKNVLDGNNFGIDPDHIWQALVLSGARAQGGFTVSRAFDEGIDQKTHIKSVSIHHYMTGYTRATTLQASFMNHTAIVGNVTRWLEPKAWLDKHKPGIPLYLAEANSDPVTNTLPITYALQGVFGSALWKVDILMYAMSQSISRYYVQQGTGFAFDSWQPVYINDSPPHVLPPWYGDVFVADVVGTASGVQVLNADLESDLLSAYGVYESGYLTKYVVVNLEEWNATTTYSRPKETISLVVPDGTFSATVAYLTAPGASSTSRITWAGQSWEYSETNGVMMHGSYNSTLVPAKGGRVAFNIQASEAVLVTWNGGDMVEQF